jgi:hypothetical protein
MNAWLSRPEYIMGSMPFPLKNGVHQSHHLCMCMCMYMCEFPCSLQVPTQVGRGPSILGGFGARGMSLSGMPLHGGVPGSPSISRRLTRLGCMATGVGLHRMEAGGWVQVGLGSGLGTWSPKHAAAAMNRVNGQI